LFVNSDEEWVFVLVTQKGTFLRSGHQCGKKVFPFSLITGWNFHFRQCLWRQIQNISLMVEYKETEQVGLT